MSRDVSTAAAWLFGCSKSIFRWSARAWIPSVQNFSCELPGFWLFSIQLSSSNGAVCVDGIRSPKLKLRSRRALVNNSKTNKQPKVIIILFLFENIKMRRQFDIFFVYSAILLIVLCLCGVMVSAKSVETSTRVKRTTVKNCDNVKQIFQFRNMTMTSPGKSKGKIFYLGWFVFSCWHYCLTSNSGRHETINITTNYP